MDVQAPEAPAAAGLPSAVAAAMPRPRDPWRRDLGCAVGVWLIARLSLSLYGWWQTKVPSQRLFLGEHLEQAPDLHAPTFPFFGTWMHWDALWYQYLALHGYRAGDNSPHFAPIFPLLAHLLLPLVGGNFPAAGVLVSSLAALVAFYLLRRLARWEGRPDDGLRAALYLCAYPAGFFLFIPYTEATCLALTVATFYCARRGHWWRAGGLGFLATLAHFQGVLIAPALVIEYADQVRRGERRPGPAALATLAPAFSLLAFAGWVRLGLGEPRSLIQIDSHWGTTLLPPWEVLQRSWQQIVGRNDGTELLNLVLVCAVVVACVAGWRYLRPAYIVFTALQLLPILIHTSYISPLESTSRYLLVAFPAFLLLGRLGEQAWAHRAVLYGFLMLQGIWLWLWVSGLWVA